MLFGSVEKPPRLSEFEMEIPNDLIAQNPADKRDHAKLMVLHRKDQAIEHKQFSDLPEYMRKGDVLVAISTSGNSRNVKRAIIQAQKMGLKTIGLLGKNGGTCKNYVDVPLIIPSNNTARIQEIHILIEHLLCEIMEHKLGLD